MPPKYPLERVVTAAREGDLTLGQSRAKLIVGAYVDTLVEVCQFARALVGSLELEHFEATVELDEEPYRGWFDWYVRPLPPELIERYGLHHVEVWYVKLKLLESENGDTVVCVSMHPAEQPSRRGRTR